MTIMEFVRSATTFILGESSKDGPMHAAFRAEETDPDLIAQLEAADYSHLPELHTLAK